MKKISLNFRQTLEAKLEILKTAKEIVLSTSYNDNVTSRIIDCAIEEDTIYFLSWKHHTKCEQIKKNQTNRQTWRGFSFFRRRR